METIFVNPFRIALDGYDKYKDQMTHGQRVFWFDSFWEEWNDTTHDGNGIFESYIDFPQAGVMDREVDYDNRIQYINDLLLDGSADDVPYFTDDRDRNITMAVEHLNNEIRIMKFVAEVVDRTIAEFPELKTAEPYVNTREVRESINEAMKDPGSYWKSAVIEFELGPGGHFDRIIRATFGFRDIEK